MKKIILSLLILSIVIFSGCKTSQTDNDIIEPEKKYTLEESKTLAQNYVKNTDEYLNSNVLNLNLEHTEVLRCPSCWLFIYTFEVEQDEGNENLLGYQVNLETINGKINNPIIYEKTFEITENTQNVCDVDLDCETPAEYLAMSSCPYQSKCINNECHIICPQFIEVGISDEIEEITTFEECVLAGNPIMESYPRKCSANGKTFVEEIENNEESNEQFCGGSTNEPCLSDSECETAGCSGQICQAKKEEQLSSTCEYKECYNAENYGLSCGCHENKCQWA